MLKFFDYLFSKLSGFFLDILAKWGVKNAKIVAARLVVLTALLAAFVVFQQTIQLLIVALIHAPNSPIWQAAAWTVLPDSAPSCLSSLITAKIAQWGFLWLSWKYKELNNSLPII
ncbi:DUF5455 family protein [Aquitalea aquatilis]|uniref:DUF5455 family protein n=1 Tax=Aquitalea aquatilis TaxID=1537400 RepID=UPI0010BD9D68|nr:DUF5455 family protein [Aquitalea aquatilis]